MSATILVLGGRSEIGVAVAERLASGNTVVLAARRSSDLEAQQERLRRAGAIAVETVEFDADDVDRHGDVLTGVFERHGTVDTVITAFGVLGDQARAERDAAHAIAIVHTDYVAQVSVLTHLANLLRQQGHGALVAYSSIAGMRVRRANYVYGSAKAGLDGFTAGLTDTLAGSGVHLLTVRPGFVIGRMTEGMSPAPLSSTPDEVADATVAGLRRRRAVVWVPRRLRLLYAVMRVLPRPLWRRMPR